MGNRDFIEFLGLWERLHNPAFNPLVFEGVRKGTISMVSEEKVQR